MSLILVNLQVNIFVYVSKNRHIFADNTVVAFQRLCVPTRRRAADDLRISLVTLNDWVNRGRIRAHKIGGRVLFRDSDVEAALHRIVPIKSR